MGVYSIDSVTRYINFYEIIKKRNAKYPFAIFNTDKHNKPGRHWWSFMDIHPIDELLFNFKKCKVSLTNQKLFLCAMKLSINSWEKLAHTKKEQLTHTA